MVISVILKGIILITGGNNIKPKGTIDFYLGIISLPKEISIIPKGILLIIKGKFQIYTQNPTK
jgi:hypothetical protein